MTLLVLIGAHNAQASGSISSSPSPEPSYDPCASEREAVDDAQWTVDVFERFLDDQEYDPNDGWWVSYERAKEILEDAEYALEQCEYENGFYG